MIKINNLEFFNKSGDNLNLVKDSKGILRGNLTLGNGKVSSGLIENEQVIVLEKVWNSLTNNFDFIKVTDTDELSENKIFYKINGNDIDNFFVFDITFDIDSTPLINKGSQNSFSGTFNQLLENITINDTEYTNIINNAVKSNFLTDFNNINLGFSSDVSGSYFGNLELYYGTEENHTLFAVLSYFIDVESEDERFTLLLDNLGSKINNSDYFIFDKSNIRDSEYDFNLLNAKRKELLLEFHNIFPYLGSYKSLINIIKFFGYENLKIKEYWKNVKVDGENFGKYKSVDIEEKLTNKNNWKTVQELSGSNIWKKTNKFAMVYKINEDSGKFDKDGVPLTQNVFEYTLDEVLIKLYGLKNKLKEYFLPLNAKIVDIIGEALYYSSYDLVNWNVFNKVDRIQYNITPTFDVLPRTYGFIEDLRPLEWIGAKIGNDLLLDGTTDKRVIQIQIDTVNFGNFITIKDNVSGIFVTERVEYLETVEDVTKKLFNSLIKKGVPFNDFFINIDSNKILIVERFTNTADIIVEVLSGKYTNTLPTYSLNEYFNGDQQSSNYGNAYLDYFFDNNFDVNNLGNNEGISVGYPIILKNTSFDITWDDLDISWNSIDENHRYELFEYSSDADFPTLSYNSGEDNRNGLAWDNIGNRDFFEVKWKIWKEQSETPYWEHIVTNNVRLSKEISVILPYAGSYNVELTLYDLYGSFSKTLRNNFITVEQQNPDFTAWKVKDLLDLKWEDLDDISWDNFNSTWDLPFLPNPITDLNYVSWMGIDRVEFYQNLVVQDAVYKSKFDVNSYTWKNLGDEVSWDDIDHTYWDNLSPSFTKIIINDLESLVEKDVIIRVTDLFGNELEELELTLSGTSGVFYDNYVEFIDKIYKIDKEQYPILSSFIYDIRLQNIQDVVDSEGNPILTGYNQERRSIVGISKEFEKPGRWLFEITGGSISRTNTVINGYGVLGDSPSSFDIYTTSTIEGTPINAILNVEGIEVTIPVLIDTLDKLVDFLRSSDLNEYWDFNIVKNAYYGNTPDYTPYISRYILCSKKEHVSGETLEITMENMWGTTVCRSITTNVSWNSLDVLYYQRDIKPYTQIYFNYDISKLPGFKNPKWKITKVGTNEVIFEWLNKYMVYLFTEPSEYTVSLTLEDTNGNKKIIRKNGFIRVQK